MVTTAIVRAMMEADSSAPVPMSGPDLTDAEVAAVVEVLRSGRLSLGPLGPRFEARFAEYVGAFEGLGIWMQLSRNAFRADLVFVAIVLATALAVALFLAVGALERLVIPWYTESRRRS